MLFFTELWERLAYYGLRSLLVLYLVDAAGGGLGWSPERASRFYGWFVGLTYLSPVFGGWMADRFLGSNRAITVGGIVLSLGYLLLALARYGSPRSASQPLISSRPPSSSTKTGSSHGL